MKLKDMTEKDTFRFLDDPRSGTFRIIPGNYSDYQVVQEKTTKSFSIFKKDYEVELVQTELQFIQAGQQFTLRSKDGVYTRVINNYETFEIYSINKSFQLLKSPPNTLVTPVNQEEENEANTHREWWGFSNKEFQNPNDCKSYDIIRNQCGYESLHMRKDIEKLAVFHFSLLNHHHEVLTTFKEVNVDQNGNFISFVN